MKNITCVFLLSILLSFVLLFIGCSNKNFPLKTIKISFSSKLNISEESSTITSQNILIHGKSSDNRELYFTKSVSNNSHTEIEVSSGSWTFYAISWTATNSDESSLGSMGGTVRCSSAKNITITDSDNDMAMDLYLTKNDCSNSIFAPSDYFSVSTNNYFYPLRVITCYSVQQNQITADSLCNNPNGQTLNQGKGSIRSFRVVFPTTKNVTTKSLYNSTIAQWKASYNNVENYSYLLETNFKSKCFTISSDASTSYVDTDLKIPVGSIETTDSPFNPMIFAYTDSTCSSSYKIYKISDGLSDSSSSSNLVATKAPSTSSSSTGSSTFAKASVFISDNPTTSISNQAKILTFSISNQIGTSVINNDSHTVSLTMPAGTVLNSLTPTITVSDGAQVSPQSGVAQNFVGSVTYTVTAQDSSTQNWVVSVSRLAGQTSSFAGEDITFKMVYVPGGLSIKTGVNDDEGIATVTNAYWIAETAVTYELWYAVRTWGIANGYTFAFTGAEGSSGAHAAGNGAGSVPGANKKHPVTYVSWRDAMMWTNALTEWFNAKNGTSYSCVYYSDAAYTTPIRTVTSGAITRNTLGSQDAPYVKSTASGFRLHTSMEYELAARYKGSDTSNSAYEYPVGSSYWWTPGNYASGATANYNNADATGVVAWRTAGNSATHDVKGKTPNALGIYDMNGNAWQWCFEWYSDIVNERVIRGNGSDSAVAEFSVGSHSNYNSPNTTNWMDNYGFRFARSDL
ncbi:MAG: SUMF1/EgtB/PvdO family nonheme iron enzyme [Oligoflexia bacterium]|nr:SUMF1/EgtB/PvdO family nonheme iron enzyme [Oligoflexia bacterium]